MNFSKSFLCLIAAAFAMTACSRRKPMNAATIDSLPADTMVLEEFFVPDPPLRDNSSYHLRQMQANATEPKTSAAASGSDCSKVSFSFLTQA
ncbi:hypothetical protein GCM10010967_33050 [Dyadobacter beijingensis]|uniref:Lipoprotein n=1 Tax=Dyadobacter beijingensis TaxID=365489 RepID=A0ABQ2I073_9BACT|nr:hypothetical protein [Dyadobacter beijingensis]GGM96722.1 hypothetical protein GCM10010967_33050 [Dyadobacter beijingensis]